MKSIYDWNLMSQQHFGGPYYAHYIRSDIHVADWLIMNDLMDAYTDIQND